MGNIEYVVVGFNATYCVLNNNINNKYNHRKKLPMMKNSLSFRAAV